MFLLVNKFKMIGMLLNIVNGQVQKSQQKHITKETNGFSHVQFQPIQTNANFNFYLKLAVHTVARIKQKEN